MTNKWLRGYVAMSQSIHSGVKKFGWAREKGLVKKLIKHWAMSHAFTCGDEQRGMIDALLDSVN